MIGIDPGTEKSGFVDLLGGSVVQRGVPQNEMLLGMIDQINGESVAIEMIASYGMPVGREVFETCVWIGRFVERSIRGGNAVALVYRRDVKLHLCNSARAKDANIRQALLDRYGGKEAAIGRRASPGPLYGVSSHAWAALAVAECMLDKRFAEESAQWL